MASINVPHLCQVESDFDEAGVNDVMATRCRVTERILNICIKYSNQVCF